MSLEALRSAKKADVRKKRRKIRQMPKAELEKYIGGLWGVARTNPLKKYAAQELLLRSDGGLAQKIRVF